MNTKADPAIANDTKESSSPAGLKSEDDNIEDVELTCTGAATVEDGAAAGCKKCQKELIGKKKMGPHDKICPRSKKSSVNVEVNGSDDNGYVVDSSDVNGCVFA